ncbi:MAG TPA: glycosyltransferase, partial [Thermoanaerobaculia bacterium]|nr:glycosyltransferase [Thermoanaerobaculia bacterium]
MNGTLPTMYVTTTLHGGGAERLLTNVLLRRGAPEDIDVVSLLPGGVFRAPLENAGIRVTDLGMHRRRDALRGLFRLAALLRERRPAAVQGWMYHANLLAFFALRLAGMRRTPHSWGIFCTDMSGRGLQWRLRLVRRVGAWLSRFVGNVVYNAAEARDFHRRIGFREPRSVVISNHIDPDVFRHDPGHRGALRRELGVDDDAVVVAVVARVDPMKDWQTVRDAVAGLPGVVTVAIGKGTDALPPQTGFLGLGWRDDV